jgi:hypothetical protein
MEPVVVMESVVVVKSAVMLDLCKKKPEVMVSFCVVKYYMRRGVDGCMMNACFDTKLLHVSCKNCCILCLIFILEYAILRAAVAGSVPRRTISARK